MWVDTVRYIRWCYGRPFPIVFRYHVGTSRSPQAGSWAGLGFGTMIQIRVRRVRITPERGKNAIQEAVRPAELDMRADILRYRSRRLTNKIRGWGGTTDRCIEWRVPLVIGEPTRVVCVQCRRGRGIIVKVTGATHLRFLDQGEGLGRVLGLRGRLAFRVGRQMFLMLVFPTGLGHSLVDGLPPGPTMTAVARVTLLNVRITGHGSAPVVLARLYYRE